MLNYNNNTPAQKSKIGVFATLGVIVVLIAGFFMMQGILNKNDDSTDNVKSGYIEQTTGNLVIPISELSSKATFYPYEAGDVEMEVLAVKASDGAVRTAFNTCQVCYSSGKGYYKLNGTTLVCQNCGNQFSPDQVEKEKGGCNPVPITAEFKQESNGKIIITKDILEQASVVFEDWKK